MVGVKQYLIIASLKIINDDGIELGGIVKMTTFILVGSA
jgi:hypothetical protein